VHAMPGGPADPLSHTRTLILTHPAKAPPLPPAALPSRAPTRHAATPSGPGRARLAHELGGRAAALVLGHGVQRAADAGDGAKVAQLRAQELCVRRRQLRPHLPPGAPLAARRRLLAATGRRPHAGAARQLTQRSL
jgi:hypothetical protein